MNMKKKRVLFVSSTGGHLNELLRLNKCFDNYDYYLVTEKMKTNDYLKDKYKGKVSYLVYGTKHHMLTYPFVLLINCFICLFIYIKHHPDYIVSTGAHVGGVMCLIGKILGSKVIFIETFANINTKTATGRLVYKFADKFIVQWDSMKEIYPDAIDGGWIF